MEPIKIIHAIALIVWLSETFFVSKVAKQIVNIAVFILAVCDISFGNYLLGMILLFVWWCKHKGLLGL